MLSVEPFYWASSGGVDIDPTPLGGPLEPAGFPRVDAAAWTALLNGHTVKEVQYVRVLGSPYYLLRTASERLLVEPDPLRIRTDLFSTESLLAAVREGVSGTNIAESTLLTEYDNYYYSRDRNAAPLPVLRVKFDDPDRTWIYIDPAVGRILTGGTWLTRIQRWIYTGFHDLDFAFWYHRRPLWDIGVITLSLGGIASSMIGLCIGFKRLFRGLRRWTR
jgi:hypothetical protein